MSRLARPTLLLVALLLPGAVLAASEEIEAAARIVIGELEAWDVNAAREAVDELLAREPDSRRAKALHAQVLFEEGDYAKSAALWDELGAPDEDMALLARATHQVTKSYESVESKHFVFRYPPGKDALLAPYALEALEKIYAAMRADLGFGPPNKIAIEVYADAKALAAVSTLPLEAIKTSGTIAICKFNRIMFTSPKALVHGYGWLDTLAHEYVHLVITMTPPTGIKGNVFLEKIYPEDPEPNHQGTTVKVTQGGETFNATTNSSGYYEVTGLASGSCIVEFDNPGASWKKVTRSANVVDGALTTLQNVTLYIGDVDNSGTINLLDILWISNRLGPVSPGNPADINKDNNVNILDLLKVHENINKN